MPVQRVPLPPLYSSPPSPPVPSSTLQLVSYFIESPHWNITGSLAQRSHSLLSCIVQWDLTFLLEVADIPPFLWVFFSCWWHITMRSWLSGRGKSYPVDDNMVKFMELRHTHAMQHRCPSACCLSKRVSQGPPFRVYNHIFRDLYTYKRLGTFFIRLAWIF